jgi:hypothetical protein
VSELRSLCRLGHSFHTTCRTCGDGNSKSGLLSYDEFCEYYGFKRSIFIDRVLEVVDVDRSGELDFKGESPCVHESCWLRSDLVHAFAEFIGSVWNYCSLGPRGLCKFVFDIMDVDKKGSLNRVRAPHLAHALMDGVRCQHNASVVVPMPLKVLSLSTSHRLLGWWLGTQYECEAIVRMVYASESVSSGIRRALGTADKKSSGRITLGVC